MLKNLNFLTKDLVVSFGYSNIGDPREYTLKKTFDGIEYTAKVKYSASAVGGFIYKVLDKETNEYVYVLLAASCNQKNNEECENDLIEVAKIKAMDNPDIVIKFEKMPSEDDVADIVFTYLNTTKLSIL